MKKDGLIVLGICILCFLIGMLVGLIGMKRTVKSMDAETVTISEISVRVNEGNLEWFNGVEWMVYGSVDELLLNDDMTVKELEEYYYPIILKRLATEESIAEAESIKASEAELAAEKESIAKAESKAASATAKDGNTMPVNSVVKPNTSQPPVHTQAPKDNYEEEGNGSSDNSKPELKPEPTPDPDPIPDPEPTPDPEPNPDPEPDNSGDGEDMEWSPDIM